jgi:hypothetical protein
MKSNWFINSNPLEKAYILAVKQSPQLQGIVSDLTNTANASGVSVTMNNPAITGENITGNASTNKMNLELYGRLRYQYSNIYVATAAGVGTSFFGNIGDTLSTAVTGVSGVPGTGINARIQESLKPVSSFMGSTLGTLTGILQDPVGSARAVPNTLSAMMNKTNPELAAKFEAMFKKHNVDKLAELPQLIFGSVNHVVQTIDKTIAVPLNIVTDIYYGVMDIMKQINDLVSKAFELLRIFLANIIRSVLPGILEFLTAVADFANQISGIASIFSGFEKITTFATSIQTYANKFNGIIRDPVTYVLANYSPPQLRSALYTLENPQELIKNLVPQSVIDFYSKISRITGVGFNGNMGYGLQAVLEAQRGGVLSNVMQSFATQFPILAPLYTGPSIQPVSEFPNSTVIASVPNGPQYNIDRTTGQIVRIMRPEPVIKPKST